MIARSALTETEQKYLNGMAHYLEHELPPDGRVVWTRIAKLAGLSRRAIYDIRSRPHVVAAVLEQALSNARLGAAYAVEAFATAAAQIATDLRSGALRSQDLTREQLAIMERGLALIGLAPGTGTAQSIRPRRHGALDAGSAEDEGELRRQLSELLAIQGCTLPGITEQA